MILISGLLIITLLVFSFRYAWWAPTVSYRQPRILMYHMVCEHKPGAKFNGLRVKPEDFERQLAWLKENNWHFVTMSELMSIDASAPLLEKTIAITFDDGFEDNYLSALPLLRQYGAKATLYLVNERENNDWSSKKKTHHSSGELMREPKLSNTQVQEMVDSGIVELGAHTLTHANLKALLPEDKQREISQSKIELERLFNVPVTSFAYPFGIYSDEDCKIAAASGFTNAVTTDGGIDSQYRQNAWQLKRLKISGKESFFAFKMRVTRGRRGFNK